MGVPRVALLGLLLAWQCRAVSHVYDEGLWTKHLWANWKLDNPLDNPTQENPFLSKAYPQVMGAPRNSLDGPKPRKPPASFATSMSNTEALDLEPLDESELVEPASKAVQCVACHAVLTKVWQKIVATLLTSGPDTVPEDAIRAHLAHVCKDEAVPAVLGRHVVYKLEGEAGQQQLILFVVRERRAVAAGTPPPAPTAAERQAVAMACKRLLDESSDDFVKVLQEHAAKFTHHLSRVWAKHMGGASLPTEGSAEAGKAAGSKGAAPASRAEGGSKRGARDSKTVDSQGKVGGSQGKGYGKEGEEGEVPQVPLSVIRPGLKDLVVTMRPDGFRVTLKRGARGASSGDEDEYDDEDDDDDEYYEEDDDDCMDLHPRCQEWADEGECEANPKYMMGHPGHRGHCRKACGLCQPSSVARKPGSPSPALAADVQSLANGLLTGVRNVACGASQACLLGVAGTAFAGGVVAKPHVVVQQSSGGFELGKPSYGIPQLRDVLPTAKPAQEKMHDAAMEARDSYTDSVFDAHKLVWTSLRGKLLRLPAEFFTFELMYRNHTRHFHEEKGKLTEDWLLGNYKADVVNQEEGSKGLFTLEPKDVLPNQAAAMAGKAWPYIKQVYDGGQECVLAGDRRVIRNTEVRFTCSPDKHMHLLVREPDFCSYIYVVYLPLMCTIKDMAPTPMNKS